MNKGGRQDVVAGVKATMTHAVHSCGIQDGHQIIYGGEAASYVLHFPDGRTLYFAGDTNVFSDMQLHFGTFPALTGRPDELASLIKDLPGKQIWSLDPGRPAKW